MYGPSGCSMHQQINERMFTKISFRTIIWNIFLQNWPWNSFQRSIRFKRRLHNAAIDDHGNLVNSLFLLISDYSGNSWNLKMYFALSLCYLDSQHDESFQTTFCWRSFRSFYLGQLQCCFLWNHNFYYHWYSKKLFKILPIFLKPTNLQNFTYITLTPSIGDPRTSFFLGGAWSTLASGRSRLWEGGPIPSAI